MNTTGAAVTAGAITVVGRWSEDEDVDVRIMVGVVFLAMILATLPDRLARPFAFLILFAVLFRYGRNIVDATGITKPRKRTKPKRQEVVPGHVFRPEETAVNV